MSVQVIRTPEQLPVQRPAANSPKFTLDEVVPYLVGHTVEEVERKLILHTLFFCCGNRTRSARALGISIRKIRNKIHQYEDLGIAVTVARASWPNRIGSEHGGDSIRKRLI
jgi:DNA-binding NtrC family response regulator